MTTWAHRRQITYATVLIIFFTLVIALPIYLLYFNNAPLCTDGKQNGDERGVDCGGSCQKACNDEVLPEPILLWTRAFPVSQGINNVVAYVQNPNVNYISEPTEYLFRVYDKDNVLLGTRLGRVSVPPMKNFPIFEPSFDAGNRQISKVFFEFTEPIVWKKFEVKKPEFEVVDQKTKDFETLPNIEATIKNTTLETYNRIEVVVVVYDESGNSAASSRTFIDELDSLGSEKVVFTWPKPFDFEPSKIEIIPKLPI